MTRPSRKSTWDFLRRPRVEEEVDMELDFHVDMLAQMLIAEGMRPDDARAEAVRRFGDMVTVRDECRRYGRQRERIRSRAEYLAELRQDVAFALRQLGRAPGFAATAALTLALGIGATAAVFSALYAVVLRPLPFADPDRVVQVLPTGRRGVSEIASGAELAAIRERRDAFATVAAAITGGEFALAGAEFPEMVPSAAVSADWFRVLGVSPAIGRGILPSDDVPGAPHVVLLSHRLWTQRFRSDTSLIGSTITLAEEPHTVIGVLPAAFDGTGTGEDLWTPLRLTTEQYGDGNGRWLRLIARLAPGVTIAQASAAAGAAVRSVAERTPGAAAESAGATVRRYADGIVGGSRERLLLLFGAVGLVLLIACVNVANLLLARGTGRARELGIRAALGAGRGRLVRQLLVESLVLSLGAAVVGAAIAYALVEALVALGPEDAARLDQTRVNGVVLAFTFGVAVACSVIAGLVPAIRSVSLPLLSALRDGGRGAVGGARHERVRGLLVAAEVALAVTLLTASGLLIRSAWRLQRVDPGFTPSHVMTARILLPRTRYEDDERTTRTYERILAAAAQVPGVERAALVSVVPLSGSTMGTSVAPVDRAVQDDERVAADLRYASPDYFSAMGIALLAGRTFTRDDDAEAPAVAVISASLAEKLWPGRSAIGERVDAIRIDRGKGEPRGVTVVGVVADVRDAALNAPPKPALYMPFTQTPPRMWTATSRSLVLVVRTTPAPETVVRELREAVASVDPSLPLTDRHSMRSWLSRSTATARFNTLLLTTLGALALVLASVGVYGVVAYSVSQRTREFGVRMALGATPRHIWRLVLGRGLRPILRGALVGIVLALASGRVLRGQLYGVTTQDPMTLTAVVATLLGVALLATLVPAIRAIRVAPARALGAE